MLVYQRVVGWINVLHHPPPRSGDEKPPGSAPEWLPRHAGVLWCPMRRRLNGVRAWCRNGSVWKWYPQMAFFYIMEKQFPKKICDKRWLAYFQSKPKYGNMLLLTPLFLLRGKPLVSCKWSLKLIHGVNFNAPSGSIAEMVVILPCRLLLRVVVVVVLVVVVVVVVVVVIVGTVVTASTMKTYLFLKVCYSAHGTPKKREQLYISPSFSI